MRHAGETDRLVNDAEEAAAGDIRLSVVGLDPTCDVDVAREPAPSVLTAVTAIACVLEGDTRAVGVDTSFSDVYRAHVREIYALLVVVTGDRHIAEELTQETFARLHRAWVRLRAPERALPYLRATALNLARSRWRRLTVARRYRPEPRRTESSPEDESLRRETNGQVTSAIRRLSTRQRECIVLRYWAELGPEQIGATLGLSVNSVKTHLRRALTSLGDALRESLDGGAVSEERTE